MKPFKSEVIIDFTKLAVTMKRENAAFEDNPNETKDVLDRLATKVSGSEVGDTYNLFDTNGNKVGKAVVTGFTIPY